MSAFPWGVIVGLALAKGLGCTHQQAIVRPREGLKRHRRTGRGRGTWEAHCATNSKYRAQDRLTPVPIKPQESRG
jgi:hypothetical protein